MNFLVLEEKIKSGKCTKSDKANYLWHFISSRLFDAGLDIDTHYRVETELAKVIKDVETIL